MAFNLNRPNLAESGPKSAGPECWSNSLEHLSGVRGPNRPNSLSWSKMFCQNRAKAQVEYTNFEVISPKPLGQKIVLPAPSDTVEPNLGVNRCMWQRSSSNSHGPLFVQTPPMFSAISLSLWMGTAGSKAKSPSA